MYPSYAVDHGNLRSQGCRAITFSFGPGIRSVYSAARPFQRSPGPGFVEPRMIPAAVGPIAFAQLTTPAVTLSSQTLSS